MVDNLKIGFVGYGKMGSAILKGLKKEGKEVYAYDVKKESVPAEIYKDFNNLIEISDIIIIATKPQFVCESIKNAIPNLNDAKIIVSIAAGIDLTSMIRAVEGKCSIVRSMPNLPASIGKGVYGLCFDDIALVESQKIYIQKLFNSIGSTMILAENDIDAFTAVVGCGPGFIFHFMEGFYQAAITLGFSHDIARELTVQTYLGTAELANNEDLSFYDLKLQVCSPKGVTIEGVNLLEDRSVKSAIRDAIIASSKKK